MLETVLAVTLKRFVLEPVFCFVLSIYALSTWRKSFVLLKYTLTSNTNSFGNITNRISHNFQIFSLTFETFALPGTVTSRSDFYFPKFSKSFHFLFTKGSNFYMSSNFSNFPNLFPNHFYNSGQRLALLK